MKLNKIVFIFMQDMEVVWGVGGSSMRCTQSYLEYIVQCHENNDHMKDCILWFTKEKTTP